MLLVPDNLKGSFTQLLVEQQVAAYEHRYYHKWLRFYLDFCNKYKKSSRISQSLDAFTQKLRDKRQNDLQIDQAKLAIALYFKLVQSVVDNEKSVVNHQYTQPLSPAISTTASITNNIEQPIHTIWYNSYKTLEGEIKLRHYSPKTFQTYAKWVRQFQEFVNSKHPDELTTEDVKSFLTHLAVDGQVAASTQNQAFNSLLFFQSLYSFQSGPDPF